LRIWKVDKDNIEVFAMTPNWIESYSVVLKEPMDIWNNETICQKLIYHERYMASWCNKISQETFDYMFSDEMFQRCTHEKKSYRFTFKNSPELHTFENLTKMIKFSYELCNIFQDLLTEKNIFKLLEMHPILLNELSLDKTLSKILENNPQLNKLLLNYGLDILKLFLQKSCFEPRDIFRLMPHFILYFPEIQDQLVLAMISTKSVLGKLIEYT